MYQRYLYSVFLIATLLFSNLGLAVNIHYCSNEIEKIELGYASSVYCAGETPEQSCCGEKEQTQKKDCCKDEIIKQKTDVVVKTFPVQLLSYYVAPAIYKFQPLVLTEIALPKKIETAFFFESNAPPLYKLYQQYLLYA